MKKFFQAIRKHDNETVRELLNGNPALANSVAKMPPKKDDGQSALQIALKTSNFEAANWLLDAGANVNFMEAEGSYDDWRMPVLHHAVLTAVMCCRHTTRVELSDRVLVTEHSTEEKADAAFAVLKRILSMGADVHAKESHGTTCASRLCKTAEEILPSYSWGDHAVSRTDEVSPECRQDLARIFRLLKESGVDFREEARRYASEPEHPLRPFLALTA